jgi:5S rRNA maturation endonuclease (ribonuclease M5)
MSSIFVPQEKICQLKMKNKYIDISRLLDDHGIEYHHTNNGWLNMACPFCYRGDGKFGLGWSGTVFSCFHCGRLDRIDVLKSLLNTNTSQTLQVMSQYQRGTLPRPEGFDAASTVLGHPTSVKLPYGTMEMSSRHKKYLLDRNFDPKHLVAEWGLKGTGPHGPYSHRIIIPIHHHGKLVCFQGRDITGLSAEKYKSCSDKDSIISIKECLYGRDKVNGDSVVVTEGPTKVWRLGIGSVCTFGATVTNKQIEALSEFKRVFILFDDDPAGRKGADNLARTLAVLNTHPTIITTGMKDAADLTDQDAEELMQGLLDKKN